MTYNEDLSHPNWKRKRAYILHRDGGKCTACGSKQKLAVHHTYYFKDRPHPWEYPNSSLLTLWGECHLKYHEQCEVEIKEQKKKKKNPKRKPWGSRKAKSRKKQKQISLAQAQSMRGRRVKKRNGDIMTLK